MKFLFLFKNQKGLFILCLLLFGAIVLLGGAGGAMAGTQFMGFGERISAITIHQWLFVFALKLLLT